MTTTRDPDTRPAPYPNMRKVEDTQPVYEEDFYRGSRVALQTLVWANGPAGRFGFFRPSWQPGPCNQFALDGDRLRVSDLTLVTRQGYTIASGPDGLGLTVAPGDVVYVVLSIPECSAAYGDGPTVGLSVRPTDDPGRWQAVEPLARVTAAGGQLAVHLLPPALTAGAVPELRRAFDHLRRKLADFAVRLAAAAADGRADGRELAQAADRALQVGDSAPLPTLLFELGVLARAADRFARRSGSPAAHEPVPAEGAGTDELVAFLGSYARFFSEDGPMRQVTDSPALAQPLTAAPRRAYHPSRVAAAVALAGVIVGLLVIASANHDDAENARAAQGQAEQRARTAQEGAVKARAAAARAETEAKDARDKAAVALIAAADAGRQAKDASDQAVVALAQKGKADAEAKDARDARDKADATARAAKDGAERALAARDTAEKGAKDALAARDQAEAGRLDALALLESASRDRKLGRESLAKTEGELDATRRQLTEAADAVKELGKAKERLATLQRENAELRKALKEDGSGKTFSGELTSSDEIEPLRGEGNFYRKSYAVKLIAGREYTIDLTSTDGGDMWLILKDEAGDKLAEDDDNGENRNARVVFIPKKTGMYTLVATTYEKEKTGSFTLTIKR